MLSLYGDFFSLGLLVTTATIWKGWAGRGVVASFAVCLLAGEAFAFYEAFVATHPPMAEIYLQDTGFVISAGVIWAFSWWLGASFGSLAAYALKQLKAAPSSKRVIR